MRVTYARTAENGFEVLCNSFAFGVPCGLDWPATRRGLAMSDAEQFEAFMHKYQNMVFSTAMRLLTNPTEAQDISQEVFLRAYQHFASLRDSPTAGGWLRTVATNLSLNHLSRYRSRWTFFSELFSAGGESEEDPPVEFPSGEDLGRALDQSDRHQVVERALRALPAAQRVPLVLFHLEGLQYDEIAARLKVSLGKVKTDIFRGREALRKKLRLQLAEEAGPLG